MGVHDTKGSRLTVTSRPGPAEERSQYLICDRVANVAFQASVSVRTDEENMTNIFLCNEHPPGRPGGDAVDSAVGWE